MIQPFLRIIPFSFILTPRPSSPSSIVYYLHTSSFSFNHVPENGFPSTNRANTLKFTANLRFPSLFPSELTTTPQPRALIRHEEANIDTPLRGHLCSRTPIPHRACFALQAHPPLFATPFNLAHSLSFRTFFRGFPLYYLPPVPNHPATLFLLYFTFSFAFLRSLSVHCLIPTWFSFIT